MTKRTLRARIVFAGVLVIAASLLGARPVTAASGTADMTLTKVPGARWVATVTASTGITSPRYPMRVFFRAPNTVQFVASLDSTLAQGVAPAGVEFVNPYDPPGTNMTTTSCFSLDGAGCSVAISSATGTELIEATACLYPAVVAGVPTGAGGTCAPEVEKNLS